MLYPNPDTVALGFLQRLSKPTAQFKSSILAGTIDSRKMFNAPLETTVLSVMKTHVEWFVSVVLEDEAPQDGALRKGVSCLIVRASFLVFWSPFPSLISTTVRFIRKSSPEKNEILPG